MRNRHFQHVRTALVAVACIAMLGGPAWAQGSGGCKNRTLSCYCEGVDRCGCLTNTGGQSCTLCCVINTKSCTFTATCRSSVKNCCR